ncbi:MAG: hypothetical protein R2784_14590 [Saprospiraceae bacterium]
MANSHLIAACRQNLRQLKSTILPKEPGCHGGEGRSLAGNVHVILVRFSRNLLTVPSFSPLAVIEIALREGHAG